MKVELKETEFLNVELPNVEYIPEQKEAIKDIAYILKASGVDKYIQIFIPE